MSHLSKNKHYVETCLKNVISLGNSRVPYDIHVFMIDLPVLFDMSKHDCQQCIQGYKLGIDFNTLYSYPYT